MALQAVVRSSGDGWPPLTNEIVPGQNDPADVDQEQSHMHLSVKIPNGTHYPSAQGVRCPTDTLWLEFAEQILMRRPAGVWVKQAFEFPTRRLESCVIHGQREQYAVEATHHCFCRQLLRRALTSLLPFLVRDSNIYWFQTLNKDQNPGFSCLFDGALLELRLVSLEAPEFGFCFPRSSFVQERDVFDLNLHQAENGPGWARRPPYDTERLQINRDGWEILYFAKQPTSMPDVTTTDLVSEICRALHVDDPYRLSLSSGPFLLWGSDFKEDDVGVYRAYFQQDIVVNSQHMKTVNGAALLRVFECTA